MNRPLCIELFSGMFGWSAGWLEHGGQSIGFDIEHLSHHGNVPSGAELVLQNVLSLHGRQFKNASLILASPPCTEFSYMAMPWTRAKQISRAFKGNGEFPNGYTGSRTIPQLTALFDACFRIQREASEAAGRHIPMVVENVKGAQPWVGLAKAHYGSFYLWGDIAMHGNRMVIPGQIAFGAGKNAPRRGGKNSRPGSWFGIDGCGNEQPRNDARDNHAKVAGLTSWSGYGQPGYKPEGFNVKAAQLYRESTACICPDVCDCQAPERGMISNNCPFHNERPAPVDECLAQEHRNQFLGLDGVKVASEEGRRTDVGKGARFTTRDCGTEATKQGGDWFDKSNPNSISRKTSGKSDSRRAASAAIAKIPLALSRWITLSYWPCRELKSNQE